MPYRDEGALFYGITPAPARAFLAGLFRQLPGKYDRLVVPCAGRLTIPLIAASSIWSPRIEASDVSLYSTALGQAALGRSMARFRVTGRGFDLDLRKPAQVLFALKLATMQRRARHYRNSLFVRNLRLGADRHIADLDEQLREIRRALKGADFNYEPLDMWQHIASVRDDPATLLIVNAPILAGDYAKMFDTGGRLTWKQPVYTDFDPKRDLSRLYDALVDAKALAIWYRFGEITQEEEGRIVFAFEHRDRTDHLCSNRRAEVDELTAQHSQARHLAPFRPGPWPILPEDYEISEESRVDMVAVKSAEGLYYRDLFAHRFGMTSAENYFVALLDDYVFASFGVSQWKYLQGGDWLFEMFGTAITNSRYRLSRLQTSMLLSTTMRDRLTARGGGVFALRPPSGFRTVALTYFPEAKGYRGLMKKVERRDHPHTPGLNMLTYQAEWSDRDQQEVFRTWLDGEKKRQKSRSGQKS